MENSINFYYINCMRIGVLFLMCFFGYSMAQDYFPNISPELSPVGRDNFDSAYAVSKNVAEKPESGAWWSKNKNIVRTVLFVAAAGSTGIAIWQNNMASKEKDKAAIWYTNITTTIVSQEKREYEHFVNNYDKSVDNVRSHENMRNGFYIGAGIFGVAGIVSLCF